MKEYTEQYSRMSVELGIVQRVQQTIPQEEGFSDSGQFCRNRDMAFNTAEGRVYPLLLQRAGYNGQLCREEGTADSTEGSRVQRDTVRRRVRDTGIKYAGSRVQHLILQGGGSSNTKCRK
jgi:hypothetical protein